MGLLNKKTGAVSTNPLISVAPYTDGVRGCHIRTYQSAAEFNEEWEDYEEPKTFYNILSNGGVQEKGITTDGLRGEFIKDAKEIGNYFLSREEAEKAVEKLKAWKRLKDKGFKVDLWDYDGGNYQERIKTGRVLFRVKDYEENDKDLDLLFGEEEE